MTFEQEIRLQKDEENKLLKEIEKLQQEIR